MNVERITKISFFATIGLLAGTVVFTNYASIRMGAPAPISNSSLELKKINLELAKAVEKTEAAVKAAAESAKTSAVSEATKAAASQAEEETQQAAREAAAALRAMQEAATAANEAQKAKQAAEETLAAENRVFATAENQLPLIIKAIISMVVLIFAFVTVFLQRSSEETRKWATGIIGVVIGFWLGTAK